MVFAELFTIKSEVVVAGLGMDVGVSEAHPPLHTPWAGGARLGARGRDQI